MSRLTRSRLEAAAALLLAVSTIVTIIWPDWIERLTGLEPDHGSGSAEWGLVALFGALSVIAAGFSRRDYVRWLRLRQGQARA